MKEASKCKIYWFFVEYGFKSTFMKHCQDVITLNLKKKSSSQVTEFE